MEFGQIDFKPGRTSWDRVLGQYQESELPSSVRISNSALDDVGLGDLLSVQDPCFFPAPWNTCLLNFVVERKDYIGVYYCFSHSLSISLRYKSLTFTSRFLVFFLFNILFSDFLHIHLSNHFILSVSV